MPKLLRLLGKNTKKQQKDIIMNEIKKVEGLQEQDKREFKILLLGTASSGKSTIIKQMQFLHGKGFDDHDRQEYTSLVYQNILGAMKNILDAMERLNIPLEDKSLENASFEIMDTVAADFKDIHDKLADDGRAYKDVLKLLWADTGVQEAYKKRNLYTLGGSTRYYYEKIDEIGVANSDGGMWIPTQEDVFRAQKQSDGIHESIYELHKSVFRMLDLPGARAERKKWIHCFDGVNSIIFVIAANEYDELLVEQKDMNRMVESVALFEQISNYNYFVDSTFILFLNKLDLLEEKIAVSPLSDYFKTYKGEHGNLQEAKNFIKDLFLSVMPKEKKAGVYSYFTNAIDSNNIRDIFKTVSDLLVRQNVGDNEIV